MDRIKINPVKATCMKCGDDVKKCGIQELNNTCYSICAAYSGTYDPYNMDQECAKACKALVEKKKLSEFGVGTCDHQQPYLPVIWDQYPHFVPQLLRGGLNPDEALKKGKELCRKNVPNLAAECIEACVTDYNAIESYDLHERIPESNCGVKSKENFSLKEGTENKWVRIGVIIGAVVIIVSVVAFFWKRNRKNVDDDTGETKWGFPHDVSPAVQTEGNYDSGGWRIDT